jgi:uncharacterized repeat protein (TIGR03803 family)
MATKHSYYLNRSTNLNMKADKTKFPGIPLTVLAFALGLYSVHALEPQTLHNFELSPGEVTVSLIEGPDGNFYGTTAHGGPKGNGTVFRVTPQGVLTTLVSDQANPAAGLIVANDGLLYGMASAGGGLGGFGSVFKMTTNGALTTFAVLDGTNGGNPQSGLVLAPDGNFYGTSPEGGTNSLGNIFRVTPTGIVTSLVSFDFGAFGGLPSAGLTLWPDGNLYGLTPFGGNAGLGTVFKITTDGIFTTLYSFQMADGFVRQAKLTSGPDGNLYGTSRDGGTADMGTVFQITTNGVYSTLISFQGTNGAMPLAELTVGADKQLYGTTQLGGSASSGTVFKVTTNGALTTLFSFPSSVNGFNAVPRTGLLLASDGNFYGCTPGTVFKMTPDGTLTTLASLIPFNGVHPQATLVAGSDGKLYGTTQGGGTNNLGSIFMLNSNGAITPVFSFSNTNGAVPLGGLTLGKDGNFYGTTSQGGSNFSGTVFRFSTDGTLTTLVNLVGASGGSPRGQLVAGPDDSLYGTTALQGLSNVGTIFRITTNGDFTRLVSFNNTNGSFPEDGLTLGQDGNFYGTTANGGSHSAGTVFRMTPTGALTTLFSFNNTNGANPLGGVVQGNDGALYGTTGFGGTNLSFGTIFKLTTNGVLTTLFNFHFTDGEQPTTKMTIAADGSLYGTTGFGGSTLNDPTSTGLGTVFRITSNGLFTSLFQFQGTNGSNPAASLTLGPDGNLYGSTANGGPGGGGTIFRIILTPMFTGLARGSNGNVLLNGSGPPGCPYSLLASDSISAPLAAWTSLTMGTFSADGTFSFPDNGAALVPTRFYRLSTP